MSLFQQCGQGVIMHEGADLWPVIDNIAQVGILKEGLD